MKWSKYSYKRFRSLRISIYPIGDEEREKRRDGCVRGREGKGGEKKRWGSWPLMKRLINFSGPLVEARGHAHAGPARRSRVHRHPSRLYLARWLCREANSFSKVLECIVSRASFHSFSTPGPTRPFHSISCIYLCSRSTAATAFVTALSRPPMPRTRPSTRRKCSSARPSIKRSCPVTQWHLRLNQ